MESPGRVRWHAIGLALLLVILFTIISGWSALLRHEIMGTGYLPRGTITLFLLLIITNAALRKGIPGLALTKSELVFVFILLMSIAAISGQEFGIHFYLNLVGLVYYSSPQSQWPGEFTPHIRPFLVPSMNDRDASIAWAFEGMPFGELPPLGEWAVPLIAWTPFLFGMYVLLVCFCGLMARQWEERERLLFPITPIPLELSDSDNGGLPSVLKSGMFWLGFIVASIPYSIRGLSQYFPIVADPNLQRSAGTVFPSGPWTAFNDMQLHLYPEMIGITYLLAREVGFSFWFFYLLRQFEVAFRIARGFDTGHTEFLTFQSVAGYLVMAAALLWLARRHLIEVAYTAIRDLIRKVRRQGSLEGGCTEGGAPKDAWAFWGTLISFFGLLAWSKWVAGASVLWTAVLLVCYLAASLIVARVVAEAGIFVYSSPFRIYQVLFNAFGANRVGRGNIVMLTAMSWVQIRSTATMSSGYLTNGFRLGSLVGVRRKITAFWMIVGILVTLLVCHITIPTVIYSYGIGKLSWWAQLAPLNTANLLSQFLRTSKPLTPHHWSGLMMGTLTTLLLIKLRLTFINFPLHPLGFVAWYGWPIDRYWLSILIGWGIKSAILRFGGYRVWYRLRPIAYGLTVGGCAVITFWTLLHLAYPTSDALIND